MLDEELGLWKSLVGRTQQVRPSCYLVCCRFQITL